MRDDLRGNLRMDGLDRRVACDRRETKGTEPSENGRWQTEGGERGRVIPEKEKR